MAEQPRQASDTIQPPVPGQIADAEKVERDRAEILSAKQAGGAGKVWRYTKLTGPGWLQSAITLGSGTLGTSLYIGVLSGFALLWMQPIAMILGIVMLSAISYVTLTTRRRPFEAIGTHVSPVLAWGWAIATLLANLVWCMPQFSLSTAAVRQNLLPGLFGGMQDLTATIIIVAIIFIIATTVVLLYDRGGRGIKIFEAILKIMVAIVVVSFFGAVVVMASNGRLDWGAIFAGYIPDPTLLWSPADTWDSALAATGQFRDFWAGKIVSDQYDSMVGAAAAAVGINMTFLLPYSMLARGWDKDFRGLARFDLSIGLFLPFLLVTSCVIIASATQFHTEPGEGLLTETEAAAPGAMNAYHGLLDARIQIDVGAETFSEWSDDQIAEARAALPEADKVMAASLVRRDARDLAESLKPLTGDILSHIIFGVGVVGMGISSIIILMLINGFVVCEMLGVPPKGAPYKVGAIMAGLTGASAPFLWQGEAKFWLAVVTSVFGFVLIPIAYAAFMGLMNSRALLGDDMPRGGKRVVWNTLMGLAVLLTGFGSAYTIWLKAGGYGLAALLVFLILVATIRKPKAQRHEST